MKREFLKELNLTDEQIDKIMAENGKDIQKHKDAVEKEKLAKEEAAESAKSIQKQLEDANKQIESFKEMDIEGIKKSADEWKEKYEADTKALKEAMQAKEYELAIDAYLNGLEFTSEFTKKAFKNEFLAKELKLNEGKLEGADEFINEFKANNEGVFKEEKQVQGKEGKEENTNNQTSNPYEYKPNGGGEQPADLSKIALDAVMGII